MNKKKQRLIPVGVAFLVIGVLLVVGLFATIARISGSDIKEISGTIVKYESQYLPRDHSTVYHAVYEYEIDGETKTYKDVDNTTDTNNVGAVVKLYYNEKTGDIETGSGISFLVVSSIASIGIGIAIIIFSKKYYIKMINNNI